MECQPQMTTWLDKQDNSNILLLIRAMKAATLCALSRLRRSGKLATCNLSYESLAFSPKGVSAFALGPLKQCHSGRAKGILLQFFLKQYKHLSSGHSTTLLWWEQPVEIPRNYAEETSGVLTSAKPYGPVASGTIARWIKTVLSKLGIAQSSLYQRSINTSYSRDWTQKPRDFGGSRLVKPANIQMLLLLPLQIVFLWDGSNQVCLKLAKLTYKKEILRNIINTVNP